MADPFGAQTLDRGTGPSRMQSTWDRIGFHEDGSLLRIQPQQVVGDAFPLGGRAGFGDGLPTRPPDIQSGVLTLRIGDRNIDRDLNTPGYNTIKIDTPAGTSVQNWVDQSGYYMWFRNDRTGQSVDGQRHYYPQSAKLLIVNGDGYELEAQRLKVNEDLAAMSNNGQSVFANIDKRMSRNPMEVVAYAGRMGQLSAEMLATQERLLTESMRSSNNPYFKIYLADVYTAQAMQPIMQQVLSTGRVTLNNPVTVQRLDAAIRLLNQASTDSRNGLSRVNMSTQGNVTMPLNPYEIYMNNGVQPYIGFWGGSYDQALSRAASLTVLRNLITTGSLSHFMQNIEILPPRMAPR